jgi:hypothetical protein
LDAVRERRTDVLGKLIRGALPTRRAARLHGPA